MPTGREQPMIKDVMVRLDGTAADEARIAAVDHLADAFDSHVIGLFINALPVLIAPETDGGLYVGRLIDEARANGDRLEAALKQRLARLQKPVEIRRYDVFGTETEVAAREARSADTFVALRPNGALREPEYLIESILFGSGRHLFLVPNGEWPKGFNHVLVAWNGARESARALAEAMPYLHKARKVTVISVVDDVEEGAVMGKEAVNHLKHHGINAALHRVKKDGRGVGATLIEETRRLKANLIVMGGYGHSRLREWLLGGTTYELVHQAPVPLLVAH
jgi:nucleotide-binding universal stress UspA family protein